MRETIFYALGERGVITFRLGGLVPGIVGQWSLWFPSLFLQPNSLKYVDRRHPIAEKRLPD